MNKTAFVEFEFNVPYMDFAYEKVDKVIKQHNNEGYKVVSITPITGSERADDIYPAYNYYHYCPIKIFLKKSGISSNGFPALV